MIIGHGIDLIEIERITSIYNQFNNNFVCEAVILVLTLVVDEYVPPVLVNVLVGGVKLPV